MKTSFTLAAATLLLTACAQQAAKPDYPAATPAAVAAVNADPAIAGILNPALPQEDRVTFLVNFARRGEIDLLNKALDAGLPINARDTLDQTPLLAAVSQNRLDVVKLLLARGADPNAFDKAGWTPLHYAAYFGVGTDVIDVLLDKGAKIDARNDRGITALYFAAGTGHEVQVQQLIARGADSSIASNAGYTPLRIAQVRGIDGIAKLLEASAAKTPTKAAVSASQ